MQLLRAGRVYQKPFQGNHGDDSWPSHACKFWKNEVENGPQLLNLWESVLWRTFKLVLFAVASVAEEGILCNHFGRLLDQACSYGAGDLANDVQRLGFLRL